ncbi:MAG: hypothetical protein AAF620_16765 [Bacteroidota bacterium]
MRSIIVLLIFAFSYSYGQNKRSIYYVSIGSTHYLKASDALKKKGFASIGQGENLDGANTSATLVAYALDESGAKDGILLKSAENKLITSNDIKSAARTIIEIAKKDKNSPLIFFYFSGHGIGEGFGWNQFLIPGDILLNLNSLANNQTSVKEIKNKAIYVHELVDVFNNSGVNYTMLLDVCYSGNRQTFDYLGAVSSSLKEITGDVSSIIKVMNQFKGSPNPVFFAGRPGIPVDQVEFKEKTTKAIGPLAKRMIKIYNLSATSKVNLTFDYFVEKMTDWGFDDTTNPGITFADLKNGDDLLISYPLPAYSYQEFSFGTGRSDFPVTIGDGITESPEDVRLKEYKVKNDSYIKLNSQEGDYIGDGNQYEFKASRVDFNVSFDDHSLLIDWDTGDDWWNFSFSAPDSKSLSASVYKNAKRYDFNESKPGLEVTNTGRGCSDIEGEFEVLSMSREADGTLNQISLKFKQYCDDDKAALTGEIQLNLK